jgi:hypothetical protein
MQKLALKSQESFKTLKMCGLQNSPQRFSKRANSRSNIIQVNLLPRKIAFKSALVVFAALANQLNGSWFFSVGLKDDYMRHVLVQHTFITVS